MTLDEARASFPRAEVKWPQGGLTRYLKAFSPGWDDEHLAEFRGELQRFAASDDGPNRNARHWGADLTLRVYSRYHHDYLHAALSNADDWRAHAGRCLAWGTLAYRFEAEVNFEARRTKPADYVPIWLDFVGSIAHTAHLVALGWDELAACQTRRILRSLRSQSFHVPTEKHLTQHFVLRLLADWQGVSSHWNWPKATRKEPLFERILSIWRDPRATEELGYLLAVACDRHLVQSSTSGRKHFDFSHVWEFYDPYEVLIVRALRQRLKLDVPSVDHPLASTLLAQPHAAIARHEEELITAVRQRARTLLPLWDLEGADFDPR